MLFGATAAAPRVLVSGVTVLAAAIMIYSMLRYAIRMHRAADSAASS